MTAFEASKRPFTDLAHKIHMINIDKGFWPTDQRDFGMIIALIHSELSEALEEYRKGNLESETYYVDGKPEGIPSEMADVIIRVLDACAAWGIDIDKIIDEKLVYNETRPYRHGDKRA